MGKRLDAILHWPSHGAAIEREHQADRERAVDAAVCKALMFDRSPVDAFDRTMFLPWVLDAVPKGNGDSVLRAVRQAWREQHA